MDEVSPDSLAAYAELRAGDRVVVLSDKGHVLRGNIISAVNRQPVPTTSQIA